MSGNPDAARSFRVAGLLGLAVASVLMVVLLCGAWLQGWRWFDVVTPSMGRAAPVGSLVVTEPARAADLRIGEIVVYTNPAGRTFSHRVVSVEPALVTKGDLNGAVDPWTVTDANLVGRAAAVVVNGGFALRGIPWLIAGLFLVQLLVLVVQPKWRSYARFLLTVLVLNLVLVIVHPLVGAQAMTYRDVPNGVEASIVSTGILPVSITGQGGDRVVLQQGEAGAVVSQLVDDKARFFPAMDLGWPWWLIGVLFVLAPLVWSLTVGFRVPPEDSPSGAGAVESRDIEPEELSEAPGAVREVEPVASPVDRAAAATATGESEVASLDELLTDDPEPALAKPWYRRGWVVRGSAALLGLLLVGTLAVPGDVYGAFTAKVRTPEDKVGSRQFFTCLDAIRAFNNHPKGVLYVGYAFGNGSGVAPQTDQSGRGYNITVSGASIPATRPCLSDAVVRGQRAWHLSGSGSGVIGNLNATITPNAGAVNDSNALTWTLWFRTTTTTGGILTCSALATLACTDRTTWMTNSGQIAFQVGNAQLLSPASYNDGSWHFLTAQLSRNAGMRLWMDGVQVAANGNVISGSVVTQSTQWGYSTAPLPVTYANVPTTLRINSDIQMGAIIAETPSGGRITSQEVLEMYHSANL